MFNIERKGEEDRKLSYNDVNCVGCGICTDVCPTSSLRLGPLVPIARCLIEMDLISVNADSLSGMMAHNYYLYESDGKLNILPWDYNLSLGGMGEFDRNGTNGATSTVNDAIDNAFSGTKFFDKLLQNEEYHEKYYAYMQQLVEEYVMNGGFEQFYNRTRMQIDELVKTDPNALYTYEEYEKALEESAKLLKNGEVVGIPTETVYGLAANALDEDAVKKIFVAKGRPSDNPLIVHIAKFEDLEPLVEEIPEKVRVMADAFWPAPLTMIMKKSDKVSNVVSGNLDTVAIRMPKSDCARAIIDACGLPLAAPSANLSGSPSPTNAKYVFDDMNGRIPLIIDGGNCEIGVESTVISFSEDPPRLLRPGGVTLEEMTELIGEIVVDDAVLNKLEDGAVAASPGMKYKHYAPSADITIIKSDFETFKNLCESEEDITALVFDGECDNLACKSVTYGDEKDGFSQSARLFDALRELDEMGAKKVYARCPETKGMGLAVYNRLIRAAGFKIKVI